MALEEHQECQQIFKENLDILINKAERLYYDGDFESAYSLCRKYIDLAFNKTNVVSKIWRWNFNLKKRVLEKDQFHKVCVPLYVSTLIHLNKVSSWFDLLIWFYV